MRVLSLRDSKISRVALILAAVSFVFLGVAQTQSARAASTLNVVQNSTFATYYSQILSNADRLIALQNSNGSWDWEVTNATAPTSTTYYNISGVTAQELLDAYTLSKDSKYLTAAEKAGNYIVSQATAVGGSNNMSTGRQNAYNIVFLLNLGTASGNSTYTSTGTDIYNTIFGAGNYWSTHNGNFCDASTGCTPADMVSAVENYRNAPDTSPDGIVPWDLVTFVQAAKLLNDSTTATAIQQAINGYVNGAAYTSSIADYSLGLSSAIRAAALVGADTSTLVSTLSAAHGISGEFGTANDGQTQATAYALMALKAAGDSSTVSSDAAAYISSQFGYTASSVTYNGWKETGSASTTEYSEVDSEAGHALFSYIYQANTYYSLSDAYNAASDGDTISLAAGTYDLTAEFDISKAITISGQGSVTLQSNNASWDTTNNGKHIIGIYAGTSGAPVTLSNLTIDSNSQSYGVNTYNNSYGELNNVTIENSKGAGLTVNGSTIIADNLNTSGNAWGAVNVDPGSGVTTPSVFTLTGSGTLAESNQIWSDGSNVTSTATVTVNATGYTQYLKAGSPAFYFWMNNAPASTAVLQHNGTNTAYSTISSAYSAAVDGDTISLGAGNYSGDLSIGKQISLIGPNAGINPNSNSTRNSEATITGQITITSGNVNVKGLTITNPSWSGSTIKGIQIYSASAVLSDIDIENNIFSNIANAQAHGSYGVMVQGVEDGVTVKNNKFDGITSAGWAHALEVTPTENNPTVAPQNVSVTGNNFSNITATGGDQYAFSVDWADSTHTADASQVTFTNNNMLTGTAVRNLDTAHDLNASGNWWGQATGPASSQVGAGVNYTPWLTAENSALDTDVPVITLNGDSDLTMFVGDSYTEQGATAKDATQGDLTADIKTTGSVDTSTAGDYKITYTVSDSAGNTGTATRTVHVKAADQDVSVGNSGSGPSTINVPKGVSTKIDLSSIVTSGSGGNSQATLNNQLNVNANTGSGNVDVQIPANITITGPSSWDGKISAPQIVTTAPAPITTDPGTSIGYTTFEVGAGSTKLTFDKAVRLLFVGKAGQRISYFDGTTPVEITTACTADSQSAADAQLTGSVTECKIDSGSDLAVWTMHFTTFVTFTVNQVTASSGGGGGGYVPTSTPASNSNNNGQVLGQITVNSDPNGSLVLDNGTVYLISNGQRRPFRSAAEFDSYGYKFSQVIPASDADKLLPEGSTMTLLDGTLVLDSSDNRTIYLIGADGVRRGFASADVFTALGYKFSQAVKFNLTGYQTGAPITSSTAAHPDGALVFDGQTVWWVNNGERHGFPTLDIFNSYGLSFKNMVPANAADKALQEGSTVLALKDALAGGSYFLAMK